MIATHLLLLFFNNAGAPAGAVNTRNKRAAAIHISLPWRGLLPVPDGSLTVDDRLHIAGYYAGMAPVVIVPAVDLLETTIEYLFQGNWINLSPDVHAPTGVHLRYGIDGSGPLDCVAGPGECTFALNNSASAARLLGAYSPFHANVRAGWTWGVPLRVTLRDPIDGTQRVKHRGKVRVIDPMAGVHRERLVHVVSYDAVYDLMEADVRSLAIATGLTEFELMHAVLDAVPSEAQPLARNLDAGIDTFSYAFHDLGDGVKALGLLKDLAVDAYAFVALKGDGTLIGRNRQTRATSASAGTFTDASLVAFSAPSALDQAFNLVRVTIHPPTIDDVPTTVLYADQTVRGIPPGQTMEFWAPYSDAEGQLIGGLDVVSPLVAGTDYSGNSQADGLGVDWSASLAITVTPFGSVALVSILNTHLTETLYLVNGSGEPFLQIRGRGVYDLGPQTYTASSTQAYGTRPITIDLRYQDDPAIAQSYAEFVEAQRRSLVNQPQSAAFIVNAAGPLMTQAILREPGDVITVSETMTGFQAVPAVVHSVELDIMAGSIVSCRWGLAPAAPFSTWWLGIPGHSELGDTTVLGF